MQGTPFFNGKLILHDPPGLANGARGAMRPFNPGNILGGNSTNGPGGFMITSPPSKFGAIPKKMPSPAAQVGFSFLPFLHANSFNLRSMYYARGVINGKAGKAAALSKVPDTLTLSQPVGGRGQITTTHWLCLTCKIFVITPLYVLRPSSRVVFSCGILGLLDLKCDTRIFGYPDM